MDWQLRDQLQCLDSDLSALLRPRAQPSIKTDQRRCPSCVRPLRPLRIQVLGQCIKSLGTRTFNCSTGLNRLQRRDLAELLSACTVEDPSVEELRAALQVLPWTTKNAATMLLPAAVPPDSRAVMLLTGRGAEPSIDKEGCTFCQGLVREEAQLCKALLTLAAQLLSWSAGLEELKRKNFAAVVLDCCRSATFCDDVAVFCADLEQMQWMELSDFSSPLSVQRLPPKEVVSNTRDQSLKRALQQDVYLEEKKALQQLQSLLASGHDDESLRKLEQLLLASLREAEKEMRDTAVDSQVHWPSPQETWTLPTERQETPLHFGEPQLPQHAPQQVHKVIY
ncbi:unnamed protein product [Durusdinium trenchii]|uniref:Uncharacterized protein n=2 Tax=Durusdinium trenchii TaxID=1381693 RepID=A0ABP0I3F9_9DINO